MINPVHLGARLACLAALGLLLGCSGDGVTPPETALLGELPPPDLGDAWSVVPVDFDAHPIVCPVSGDVASPAESFELTLGTWINGSFVVAAELAPLEIVHGPQGGIHVEVAFRVVAPAGLVVSGSTLKARAAGQTVQPCCQGQVVGGMVPHTVLLTPEPGSAAFVAADDLVIFYNANAGHFEDKECCVALEVGLMPPGETEPSVWAQASARFLCVNVF